MSKKDVGGQPGLIIERTGPDGWSIIGTGALIGIALVIIALAMMELAAWAGVALIVLAAGQAGLNFCRGAALIIAARNARAEIEAGIWREVAWQQRQRRPEPGPKARRDMVELWGEENADPSTSLRAGR